MNKPNIIVIKQEIWDDIKNYQGLYQVSNLGRIKSLERKCISKNNKERKVSERILSIFPNKSRCNYIYVTLNNRGLDQFRVHRLVAEAFIPNPDNLPQVNHIDGNKQNNNVDNLEWCTGEQNMQHSYKIGTHKIRKGNNASYRKLTELQVEEIRKSLVFGTKGRDLSKKYNISEGMISLIKNNKYWL